MKQTTAKSETIKKHIKKELRKLFRSMDFISKKFLADGSGSLDHHPLSNIDL